MQRNFQQTTISPGMVRMMHRVNLCQTVPEAVVYGACLIHMDA